MKPPRRGGEHRPRPGGGRGGARRRAARRHDLRGRPRRLRGRARGPPPAPGARRARSCSPTSAAPAAPDPDPDGDAWPARACATCWRAHARPTSSRLSALSRALGDGRGRGRAARRSSCPRPQGAEHAPAPCRSGPGPPPGPRPTARPGTTDDAVGVAHEPVPGLGHRHPAHVGRARPPTRAGSWWHRAGPPWRRTPGTRVAPSAATSRTPAVDDEAGDTPRLGGRGEHLAPVAELRLVAHVDGEHRARPRRAPRPRGRPGCRPGCTAPGRRAPPDRAPGHAARTRGPHGADRRTPRGWRSPARATPRRSESGWDRSLRLGRCLGSNLGPGLGSRCSSTPT